ncbi:MAG: zinc ribbon domain-containing protein [Methanomassiliicoccales archaeon]|nr:zinc ribbon domain-containing protein [Methanomassiliicoccales archaeon]
MPRNGEELASDRLISKGGLVRTLSVSDPSIKRKRLIINASLLDLFILNGAFLYCALFLASTPLLVTVFLSMIPIMTLATLLMHVFLKSVLGKSFYPISIYSNGIEFPTFLFNRMIGRPAFLEKGKIESGWTRGFPEGVRSNEMKEHRTLYFKTKTGRMYDTGARNRSEIEPVIDWIEKNWEIKVRNNNSPIVNVAPPSPLPTARKVRVIERYCPQCGRSSDGSLLFCPYCGTNFDPVSMPTEQRPADNNWKVPTEPPYEPYVRSFPEPPMPEPTYQPQYPSPVRDRMAYANGKNPRLAFILGLMLGFMGLMGIGHLYMGKRMKGVALLLIGGFLAMLSLVSVLTIFGPSEYALEVRVVTAALLSAPYLVLQLWQAFDAPKSSNRMPRSPY